jgi:hypothetical protein
MLGKLKIPRSADGITEDTQITLCRHTGVELTHRSGSRIARIGERRFVVRFPLGVDAVEFSTGEVDLAANFDGSGQIGNRTQPERKAPEKRFEPRPQAESPVQRYERTLLLLLARNLISKETVKREDFDTELYARMAEGLQSGLSAAAVLDRVDEGERQQAARAMQDEVLPNEKNALTIAEDCLRRIRFSRMEAALALLQEELATAKDDRRRELIEQMSALTSDLERLRTGRKEWTV